MEQIIAIREREAKHNEKVAEEWLDLMHFSSNRLTEINEQLVLLPKRTAVEVEKGRDTVSAGDGVTRRQ